MSARTILVFAPLLFFPVLTSCDRGSQESSSEEVFQNKGPFKAGVRVIPGETLLDWGYETANLERGHAIKSRKNYGDDREAFYARFLLGREEFESSAEADLKREEFEQKLTDQEFAFKNYTRVVQKGEVLYYVTATSNYTFLDHQPKLMSRIEDEL